MESLARRHPYKPSPLFKFLTAVIVTFTGGMGQTISSSYIETELKQSRPFIYEIEKEGKVSHILGSMHAGIPLDSYPQQIFELAAEAKSFAAESDPESIPAEVRDKLKKLALFPEGQSLKNQLSSKGYLKFEKLVGSYQAGLLAKYRPFVLYSPLSQLALERIKSAHSAELWNIATGIDATLIRYARGQKKPLTFLDDLSQLAASVNEKATVADFEKLMSYPDPVGHIAECAMLARRSYFLGHEENFQNYGKKCETPGMLKHIQLRNKAWIPKIEPMLQEGKALIVVGALHMNGPTGIQALLEKKGYSVRRILQKDDTAENSVTQKLPDSVQKRVKSVATAY